jgi:hypothetical protein
MKHYTIGQIVGLQKKAAKAVQRVWWFGPLEARFFDYRLESESFMDAGGTHYFISSEQCHFSDGSSAPRLYSVRSWNPKEPAQINTVGKFQEFERLADARARIQQLCSGVQA